ncbi:hypothetical protein [Sphaerisporangium perillae]|uniref:hypothetical protein n=1 Tax=Sphaerisporangium perillae TaxID=2935860 RepID=UPI00200E56FE|nr:hypothetical protein [Sphaerisporangium perillae]
MNESQKDDHATGQGDLPAGAKDLGSAIEQHARVLAESPGDYKRVVQAVNRLRASALAYATLCADQAGWGNPFSDLESDLESEEETTEESAGAASEEAPVVHLEAHYRIRVTDMEAAARLAGDPESEDLLGAPSDVVSQLFMRDGWDPSRYGDVLEVLDQSWSCGPDLSS